MTDPRMTELINPESFLNQLLESYQWVDEETRLRFVDKVVMINGSVLTSLFLMPRENAVRIYGNPLSRFIFSLVSFLDYGKNTCLKCCKSSKSAVLAKELFQKLETDHVVLTQSDYTKAANLQYWQKSFSRNWKLMTLFSPKVIHLNTA